MSPVCQDLFQRVAQVEIHVPVWDVTYRLRVPACQCCVCECGERSAWPDVGACCAYGVYLAACTAPDAKRDYGVARLHRTRAAVDEPAPALPDVDFEPTYNSGTGRSQSRAVNSVRELYGMDPAALPDELATSDGSTLRGAMLLTLAWRVARPLGVGIDRSAVARTVGGLPEGLVTRADEMMARELAVAVRRTSDAAPRLHGAIRV